MLQNFYTYLEIHCFSQVSMERRTGSQFDFKRATDMHTPPDPPVCVLYHPHLCPVTTDTPNGTLTAFYYVLFICFVLIVLIIFIPLFDAVFIVFYSIVVVYSIFYYFILPLCVLFLICFAVTYSKIPHSFLLMVAIFSYSVQQQKQWPLVHQFLLLHHLFRRNLTLYWLSIDFTFLATKYSWALKSASKV